MMRTRLGTSDLSQAVWGVGKAPAGSGPLPPESKDFREGREGKGSDGRETGTGSAGEGGRSGDTHPPRALACTATLTATLGSAARGLNPGRERPHRPQRKMALDNEHLRVQDPPEPLGILGSDPGSQSPARASVGLASYSGTSFARPALPSAGARHYGPRGPISPKGNAHGARTSPSC